MHLSERERSICRLVALGKADKEIADELQISNDLVRYYLKSLFRKTGARSRTTLAVWFLLLSRPSVDQRLLDG
jgi:DNA-binding NarL/FixJ family response regulator